jgi:hypothetical protein
MTVSNRHVIQFLEKEIKTYRALALFLSKVDVTDRVRVKDTVVLLNPTFYTVRMKEAQKLVNELKKIRLTA